MISYIRQTELASGSGGSLTTSEISVTAGNIVIAILLDYSGSPVFSDSDGNTWYVDYYDAVKYIAHCYPSASGALTVTASGLGFTNNRLLAAEFSGVENNLTMASGYHVGNGFGYNVSSGALAVSGDFVYIGLANIGGGGTTIGTGWNRLAYETSLVDSGYLIDSDTQTFTATKDTEWSWSAVIVAFAAEDLGGTIEITGSHGPEYTHDGTLTHQQNITGAHSPVYPHAGDLLLKYNLEGAHSPVYPHAGDLLNIYRLTGNHVPEYSHAGVLQNIFKLTGNHLVEYTHAGQLLNIYRISGDHGPEYSHAGTLQEIFRIIGEHSPLYGHAGALTVEIEDVHYLTGDHGPEYNHGGVLVIEYRIIGEHGPVYGHSGVLTIPDTFENAIIFTCVRKGDIIHAATKKTDIIHTVTRGGTR